MNMSARIVSFLCAACAASGQNVLPPIGPQAELPPAAVLPSQRLGAGDLVNISVYAAPELSRPVRIGDDGKVRIPMVDKPIQAAKLMPDQLAGSIAAALKTDKIMVDPLVTVTVTEYMSRPVSVTGAVRHPTTFQAYGQTSLLEAISKADGLTQDAGPEVVVTFPAGPGGEPTRPAQRISVKELMDGADARLNLALHGGEEIRVPEAQKIYVWGNVKKPGAYAVRDAAESSVMKALSLSEGLMPFVAKQAYIYRQTPGQRRGKKYPCRLPPSFSERAPMFP